MLIIFSVVLALGVTEVINNMNEEKETRVLVNDIRNELIHNKKEEEKQYQYHLEVIKKIDSALAYPEFAQQVFADEKINLELIANHGILYGDLDDVAWEIAKSQNIASRIDMHTLSLLNNIYNNQQKIIKVEDEIGKLLLSSESRKAGNAHLTLTYARRLYRLGNG